MRGTQTHRQRNQIHFTENETEVQRDPLIYWKLWFACLEIGFSQHSNAKHCPHRPTGASCQHSGLCQEQGIPGSRADGAGPAISELAGPLEKSERSIHIHSLPPLWPLSLPPRLSHYSAARDLHCYGVRHP